MLTENNYHVWIHKTRVVGIAPKEDELFPPAREKTPFLHKLAEAQLFPSPSASKLVSTKFVKEFENGEDSGKGRQTGEEEEEVGGGRRHAPKASSSRGARFFNNRSEQNTGCRAAGINSLFIWLTSSTVEQIYSGNSHATTIHSKIMTFVTD